MKQKLAISQICIIVAITTIGSMIGFLWMGFWGSLLVGSIFIGSSIAVIGIVSENNHKHTKMKFLKKLTLMDMLVASAVAGLIATIIVPVRKPHPMSPHRRTLRNMYDIDWYPYGYYCKNNKWPDEASWKEDIKEFIKNTLPYTKPETLDYCFIDGWENPIQYRIVDHNDTQTVLLYSFGKNKVDDNGTGDDITREIEVPTQKDIDHYKAKTKAATTGGVML